MSGWPQGRRAQRRRSGIRASSRTRESSDARCAWTTGSIPSSVWPRRAWSCRAAPPTSGCRCSTARHPLREPCTTSWSSGDSPAEPPWLRRAGKSFALGAQLEAEYPESNRGRGMVVEPLTEVAVGGVRPALLLLLGAVTLLLLVACVNVASLLLAQSWGRAREFALRRTLGASTGRLARQFLLESLLLTGTAAFLGVLLTDWGLDLLLRLAPSDLPRLSEVKAGNAVLLAALGLSVLTGLGFGLLPLAQAWRLDLHAALQGDGGRTASSGPRRRRLRDALVVGEIALSALLVIGAGLLVRSLYNLKVVDPGFRSEQVMKFQFRLPASRYPQSFADYPNWNAIIGLHRGILERAGDLPGVRSAALAGYHPLDPGFTNSFVIEGREGEFAQQPEIPVRPVSPCLLRDARRTAAAWPVLDSRDANRRARCAPDQRGRGASLLRGTGSDRPAPGVLGTQPDHRRRRRDERFRGVAEEAPPAVYPPIAQVPMASAVLLVRAEGDLTRLSRPSARWYGAWTHRWRSRTSSRSRRRSPLHSLGPASRPCCSPGSPCWPSCSPAWGFTVCWDMPSPSGPASSASGCAGRPQAPGRGSDRLAVSRPDADRRRDRSPRGLALTRLLRGLLFGVAPTDPAVFAATALSLAAVGIVASCLPARRASRVDPMVALWSE